MCHNQPCRDDTCATTRRAASVYALFNYCSMAAWLTCYCGAFMPRDAVLHMQCYNSLACNVCERGTYLSLVALRIASVAAQGPHPATCGVIWSDHAAHLAAATACRQPSAPFSLSEHSYFLPPRPSIRENSFAGLLLRRTGHDRGGPSCRLGQLCCKVLSISLYEN